MDRNLRLTRLLPIAVLVAVAAPVVFFRLGANALPDSDPAIHAEVSREMVLSGDWLTPHWDFAPWYQKPPLRFWINALFFSAFGINEFWARAVSAFSAIAVLIISYLIGRRLYNAFAGMLAGIILLANPAFLSEARLGTTDILLSVFVLLTLLAYLHLVEDERYWYAIGASFSLAFMTKSWAALLLPLIVLLGLILDGRLSHALRSRHLWGAVLLSIALILPWHVYMLVRHSGAFVADYFTFNLIARAVTTAPGDAAAPSFYLSSLEEAFGLWFALVPFAIVINGTEYARHHRRRATPILLVAIGVIFMAFTLSESKLEWYVMPLYPPLCILLATIMATAWKSMKSFAFGAVAYSLVLAFLAAKSSERFYLAPILFLAIVGLLIVPPLRRWLGSWAGVVHEQSSYWLRQAKTILASSSSEPGLPVRLGKLLVGVSIAFFVVASFGRAANVYTVAPSPVADLAKVAAKTNSSAPLVCVDFQESAEDVVGYTTLFYSGRRVVTVHSPEELAKYTAGVSGAEIMLHRSRMAALSADYDFDILATSDGFVYAVVHRKPG